MRPRLRFPAARRRYPAANHAAEALVIYDLQRSDARRRRPSVKPTELMTDARCRSHSRNHDETMSRMMPSSATRFEVADRFRDSGMPVIGDLGLPEFRKGKRQIDRVRGDSFREVRQTNETVPSLPMVDVTAESGINFVHETGRYGDKLLPETMGSGVAVLTSTMTGI